MSSYGICWWPAVEQGGHSQPQLYRHKIVARRQRYDSVPVTSFLGSPAVQSRQQPAWRRGLLQPAHASPSTGPASPCRTSSAPCASWGCRLPFLLVVRMTVTVFCVVTGVPVASAPFTFLGGAHMSGCGMVIQIRRKSSGPKTTNRNVRATGVS